MYGLNFDSISPSVPDIKGLDTDNTDRRTQTDGQQNDIIRVPFFLKKYGTLEAISTIYDIFY